MNFLSSRRGWRWLVSKGALRVAAGGLSVVAAVLVYTQEPGLSQWFPPCPFRAATGLRCPGCGSLRAVHHALHGDLITAFWYNPLLFLSLPLLGYLMLVPWLASREAPERVGGLVPSWLPWTVLVVLVAYWIARNLPIAALAEPVAGGV